MQEQAAAAATVAGHWRQRSGRNATVATYTGAIRAVSESQRSVTITQVVLVAATT